MEYVLIIENAQKTLIVINNLKVLAKMVFAKRKVGVLPVIQRNLRPST